MRRTLLWIGMTIGLIACSAYSQEQTVTIIPRVAKAPVIDGVLTDDCWSTAVKLTGWTEPATTNAPVQHVEAFACYDNRALYVAVNCYVSDPGTIVAAQKEKDVWQDDCVELWIKSTGDEAESDQFIVNSASVKEIERKRSSHTTGFPANPEWQARSVVGTDRWVCEVAIPFTDLGRSGAPEAGESEAEGEA